MGVLQSFSRFLTTNNQMPHLLPVAWPALQTSGRRHPGCQTVAKALEFSSKKIVQLQFFFVDAVEDLTIFICHHDFLFRHVSPIFAIHPISRMFLFFRQQVQLSQRFEGGVLLRVLLLGSRLTGEGALQHGDLGGSLKRLEFVCSPISLPIHRLVCLFDCLFVCLFVHFFLTICFFFN